MENINDKLYTTMCSERTIQSNKSGFFLQFADHVVNVAGSEWLNNKFGILKTDRQRIEVLVTDEKVKDIICDTLSNVQCIYRKKDAKISKQKRQDAEVFIETRNLTKALVMYCQSVLRAPPKGEDPLVDAGKTLSLALWGRSEVLSQLGEASAALNDLQLALKEGLPDRLKPEMYIRMAACYNALNEEKRAKICFSLAEKMFGEDRKTDFERTKANFKLTVTKNINRKLMPKLSGSIHSELKNASSLLELKESPDMGRYFVAKKFISTGDTLVVEPPKAACLLPENFGSHCHNCLQRLLAPIGCPVCVGVAFCSSQCLEQAMSTYHKFECKILDMLIGSGMSILCHVALRMITQEGLKRCLEISKDRSLDCAQSLCKHDGIREPKDFLQRSLMALFLLRCLQKTGFFPDKKDDDAMVLCEEEFQIGELLLSNLQLLQFNAHEIYESKHAAGHRFKTFRSGYVGVGIYSIVALFNHDCYPGVLRYFVDRNIVIKANKPFQPGETVSENYGPVFLKKTLAQRQRSLLSRYWFKCRCVACKEDWPLLEKLHNKHGRLKCVTEGCKNLFSQPVAEITTCPRCKEKICLKTSIEQLKHCEVQYLLGINLLDAEQPEKAIPVLMQALNMFHSIASPPHKYTHLAQEALRTCFADTGNVYQCLVVME